MRLASVVLVVTALLARFPLSDHRNAYTPHTRTVFELRRFVSAEEWERQRRRIVRQIRVAAGLDPMPPRTPLHPRRFGRLVRPGFAVERVVLETFPGLYLAGNLYLPQGRSGKAPAVLIAHGHWRNGRVEDLPEYSVPALAANLALQGFVAFAYDMVGYGDSRQLPHEFGESAREQLWSFTPFGLQTWNSIRALDFLTSLEEVDPARIGMTGASGGGTQTFILAALDDRVKVSIPVNMVSAHFQGGSPCENAPRLRVGTNNVEIAAAAAPRPMLLIAATGDWTRDTPAVEFPAVRSIYELLKHPDRVSFVQVDAGHNYNGESREAAYRFFRRWLGDGKDEAPKEAPVHLSAADLLIGEEIDLPLKRNAYDVIFARWREMAAHQAAQMSPDELRQHFQAVLGVEYPEQVAGKIAGAQVLLTRPLVGDMVPGIWLRGRSREAAVVVHPQGSDAARKSKVAEALETAGASLLYIDVFQTGAAIAPRDHSARFHLTFNLSDDANRVQDILTAVRFLEQQGYSRPQLIASAGAEAWALAAAAMVPSHVRFSSESLVFSGDDAEAEQRLNVPGLQRAGGLRQLLALAPR